MLGLYNMRKTEWFSLQKTHHLALNVLINSEISHKKLHKQQFEIMIYLYMIG
jgi:hypothetical protein